MALGVLGAGIMGERLLAAAADWPGLRIAGLWDPSDAALGRVTTRWPGIPAAPTAADVIAASDCIYVASPPATHLVHARAALEAGKAVFCEKPLAVDVTDAGRFLTDWTNARIAVNFPFASSPAVEQLGRWLAADVVGQPSVVAITVAFSTWPRGWQHAASGWLDGPTQGGFTREVVSHFLFLARRLFGPLRLLEATAHGPDPSRSERAISARLLAGQVPVELSGAVGATTEDDVNRFTITGPAGTIRLRNWATAEREVDGEWQSDPHAIPHEQARPLVLQRQLDGVISMTKGGPHHLATAAEAFDVQSVVEAILQSRPQ